MSRIGRKPITVPQGTKVELSGNELTVSGPKGVLSVKVLEGLDVGLEEGVIWVKRKSEDKRVKGFHGLVRMLIANSIEGVNNGFSKTLEIVGTGYKAELQGKDIIKFNLGYSHPIEFKLPEGITASVEDRGTKLTIQGIDKQLVGEVAAKIRSLRKPDAYKGKGIRYSGEMLKLKPGKSGAKV